MTEQGKNEFWRRLLWALLGESSLTGAETAFQGKNKELAWEHHRDSFQKKRKRRKEEKPLGRLGGYGGWGVSAAGRREKTKKKWLTPGYCPATDPTKAHNITGPPITWRRTCTDKLLMFIHTKGYSPAMRYLSVLTRTHLENRGVEWEKQFVDGDEEYHHVYGHHKSLQSSAMKYVLFADRCLYRINVKTQRTRTLTRCCSVTNYFGNLHNIEDFLGKYRLSKLPQRYVKHGKGSITLEGILQVIDKRVNPPGFRIVILNMSAPNNKIHDGETKRSERRNR